jgi:hypothetical protein
MVKFIKIGNEYVNVNTIAKVRATNSDDNIPPYEENCMVFYFDSENDTAKLSTITYPISLSIFEQRLNEAIGSPGIFVDLQ